MVFIAAGLISAGPALASSGGEIRGRVTSASTSAALPGVEVCAEQELFGGCAKTGPEGEYAIAELPEGSYTVLFDRTELEGYEYLAQYYSEQTAKAEANPVAVVAEAATLGINAALARQPLPAAPTAETLAASAITSTGATLNASVNPNGSEVTECRLEFGTGIGYGKSEPCPTPPGAGRSPVAEALVLSGLTPATEYHYRVLAANALGSTPGEDMTFVSLPNPPAVAGVGPDAGLQEGHTSVTVTGSGFSGASAVKFGSTAALHFTIDSATEITAESPAGSGTVHVTVSNAGGTSTTGPADLFSYVAPGPAPTISVLSTKSGPSGGGTGVVISGTGFTGATAVRFGTERASSFKVETPSSLVAVSPPGTTGPVEVTVTTPNGTSATTAKTVFKYGSPAITGVSPASGSKAGGTFVTASGSGFAVGAGLTTLEFGKTAGSEVVCSSSTRCTVSAPAATRIGSVDVRAKVGGKTSPKSPSLDQFKYT